MQFSMVRGETPPSPRRNATDAASVFRPLRDNVHAIFLKTGIQHVEIAPPAVNAAGAVVEEQTSLEGEIVIVEAGEFHAGPGIVEDAVLEGRLGIGTQIHPVVLAENAAGAEIAEGQKRVPDLRFEFAFLIVPHAD